MSWPRHPDGTAKPVAAFTDAELAALLRAHLPRQPITAAGRHLHSQPGRA